ncbi:GNAT family N-acetyltransferase [Nocardia yamanashiensis]|uniref:GNAT family N-acetyltransferase n=1 Tax=Nocardia yamanashiensis TaxID=209247 RepID=UPI00082B5F38|nr:GNAT family protein [Nocardia yamanashiensis]
MDPHALTDGSVWLSPPAVPDIDAITACCQEPSIPEWTTMPSPYHRADAEKFVYDFVLPGWAGGSPTWALRRGEGQPVVGMIGLNQIDSRRESGAAEVGFWMSGQARGAGLMTRALNLVCAAAFDRSFLGLERIEWRAIVGNHASAAVARRCGFTYEGLLRGGCVQRGVRRDSWIAGRLHTDPPGPAPDWPAGV